MTATARPATPTVVHLIPHTHWDREWYEPFQTFRLRLVDLVDELLARMESDSRLRFTLDGQCATVDDYLEVRPEAEPLIRRLVAEGRLAIGPWQILMDEFLVSGETMVRNLELGWARAILGLWIVALPLTVTSSVSGPPVLLTQGPLFGATSSL